MITVTTNLWLHSIAYVKIPFGTWYLVLIKKGKLKLFTAKNESGLNILQLFCGLTEKLFISISISSRLLDEQINAYKGNHDTTRSEEVGAPHADWRKENGELCYKFNGWLCEKKLWRCESFTLVSESRWKLGCLAEPKYRHHNLRNVTERSPAVRLH